MREAVFVNKYVLEKYSKVNSVMWIRWLSPNCYCYFLRIESFDVSKAVEDMTMKLHFLCPNLLSCLPYAPYCFIAVPVEFSSPPIPDPAVTSFNVGHVVYHG